MGEGGEECLRVAMQIARSHHERWDGEGYPDGLRGEDIPLAARLMAVADVYDAMLSPRCYRNAGEHARASAYIAANAGRHFDPVIVEAFLSTEDAFRAAALRRFDEDRTNTQARTANDV